MSVMLAQNLRVINSTFSNTSGTLPAAGLDIEPDHPNYQLVNISFEDCSFIANAGGGISINTATLNKGSTPISISFTNIDVVGGIAQPWLHRVDPVSQTDAPPHLLPPITLETPSCYRL